MNDRTTAREPRPADPHPRLRLVAFVAVALGVVLLAAAAFVFSYRGIHQIARAAGVSPSLARAYPLIFDAMLVVAFAAALGLRGARWWTRLYVWVCTLVLLAAVAAGDAVRAMGVALPRKPSAAAVAVIPWALLLIAFGFLLAMLRQLRRARLAATVGAAADAARAAGVAAGSGHPARLADGSEPGQGLDMLLGARPADEAPSLGGKLAARPQPATSPGIRPQPPSPVRRAPAGAGDGTAPGGSRQGSRAAGDAARGPAGPRSRAGGDSAHGDGVSGNGAPGDGTHEGSSHGDTGAGDGAHGQDKAGDSAHRNEHAGDSGQVATGAGHGAHDRDGAGDSARHQDGAGDSARHQDGAGDSAHGDTGTGDSGHGKDEARDSAQGDSDPGGRPADAAANDEAAGPGDRAAAVEDSPEKPAAGDEKTGDGGPGLPVGGRQPLPTPPVPFDRLHSTPTRPQD